MSFTIPLTITISLGAPAGGEENVALAEDLTEKLAEPFRDTDYTGRAGYREDFLAGHIVPMPKAADPSAVAPLIDDGDTLKYGNFSVQMHASRRLALFTASNVTAEAKLRRPEEGFDYTRRGLSGLGPNDMEKWFPDPRIAPEFQLSDRFYTQDEKAFDKGHIVRRDDVAFGESYAALRLGNGDTYHITNCSPQVGPFNQSARGEGNWGDLENLVLKQAASERYCLFAGPVLDPGDQIFLGKATDGSPLRVRIPRAFWKVVVAPVEDGVASYAFVLDQDLSIVDLEFAPGDVFRRAMISIPDLERATGLVFPDIVRVSDRFDDEEAIELAVRNGVERVVVIEGDAEERVAENPGDDEDAAIELMTPEFEDELTEGPNDFRLAKALEKLRTQVNTAAPRRSKKSDGWIGDAKHRTRNSDHNPWVRDGGTGVVTAIDITHDIAGGCDACELAEALRDSRDKRIKYIIWNRQIANRDPMGGKAAWAWRPYTGKNPHDKHVHISVQPEKALYDAVDGWQI